MDPFSKSRTGNESNPFVPDVETGHVSVPDDSDEGKNLMKGELCFLFSPF